MATHAELQRPEPEARRLIEAPAPEPVAVLSAALAGGDPGSRARAVGALQRSYGNAAVGRMIQRARGEAVPPPPVVSAPAGPMETHTEVQTFRLNAKIAIGPQAARPSPQPRGAAATADTDVEPGQDHQDELNVIKAIAGEPAAAAAAEAPATPEAPATEAAPGAPPATPEAPTGEAAPGTPPATPEAPTGEATPSATGEAAPSAPAAEAAPEQAVTLPDIEVKEFENVDLCDAITPWLSYSGTISQGGAPPTGFGVTRPGPMTVTGITVRKVPILGWWYVGATITQEIKWQVRAATGPSGQVNITSALDPAITAGNWRTVMSDLTPNMADLNGRPPRTAFWAKDITETHEAFHANDRKTQAPGALALASTWLGTQQAATPADVGTLLAAVPGRMVSTVSAGMTFPGKEERAYGDGAGAYTRRATAIWALGNIGAY